MNKATKPPTMAEALKKINENPDNYQRLAKSAAKKLANYIDNEILKGLAKYK